MSTQNSPLRAKILLTTLTIFLACEISAARAESVEQAKIAQCQSSKAVKGGQMPWGATDKDLISYQGKNLCTFNDGRPIGENCSKTLDKLYTVGKRLNDMVKAGCEKYVPLFVAKPEMLQCMKGQNKCPSSANAQLAELKNEIKRFKAELKNFNQLMKEQQQYVVESSGSVVDVLEETERARHTPAYGQWSKGAQEMGVSTISAVDELNGLQSAVEARGLWQELQKKFEKSENNYANATEANYQQKLKPISESFEKVGQLKSKVLREQMHGFLKAEELKLATRLYDNQLNDLNGTTTAFEKTNEESSKNLGSLPSNQDAFPSMASLAGGSAGENSDLSNLKSDSLKSDLALADYEAKSTYIPGEKSAAKSTEKNGLGTTLGDTGKGKSAISLREVETAAATDGKDGATSSTSASRSPASLRDALRKKLAEKGVRGEAGDFSAVGNGVGAGANNGEAPPSAAESLAAATGIRGMDGEGAPALGPGGDSNLADFGTENLEGGAFSLDGAGTDESVKGLLSEFKAALGMEEQASEEIGASEGPTLFVRVKEFHGRCQKRGCVTGMRRDHI